jgi:hypothetical protein
MTFGAQLQALRTSHGGSKSSSLLRLLEGALSELPAAQKCEVAGSTLLAMWMVTETSRVTNMWVELATGNVVINGFAVPKIRGPGFEKVVLRELSLALLRAAYTTA